MMTSMHIDDDQVRDAIERAASAACQVLDETFPGREKDGITSNFQGLLAETLGQMLAGNDHLRLTHRVVLPRLVHTDDSFGDIHQRGDGYVVGDPTSPEGQLRVLSDSGMRFVPLDDSESVDPFTSFSAAVQGAMKYLKTFGGMDFMPQVYPVFLTENGWELKPAAQAAA